MTSLVKLVEARKKQIYPWYYLLELFKNVINVLRGVCQSAVQKEILFILYKINKNVRMHQIWRKEN